MTALLAAIAVLATAACVWELAGSELPTRGRTRLDRMLVARRLGRGGRRRERAAGRALSERLVRAGIADRISPSVFVATRAAGALAGAAAVAIIAPASPGRLLPIVGVALIATGALVPDALAERAGRHRRARIEAALPDAVDLLAVGVAAGRDSVAMLGELARTITGPLATELGRIAAAIDCGTSRDAALAEFATRCCAPGVSTLVAAIGRARRFGSPLADQLHAQAETLRRDERRRIEERAARAAPKIQLVVALILVPSALLAIAAALVAHSDALLTGF